MQPQEPNKDNTPNDTYEHQFNLNDIPEIPLSGHQWRQMGNWLECTSCSFSHGTFIPTEYQLYGIDNEGKPMIRKIEVKD